VSNLILSRTRHQKGTGEAGRLIEQALTRTGGNKAKAARLLGITRAQLYHRLDGREPAES
jgi:DNA-binding NtrC family response regulator